MPDNDVNDPGFLDLIARDFDLAAASVNLRRNVFDIYAKHYGAERNKLLAAECRKYLDVYESANICREHDELHPCDKCPTDEQREYHRALHHAVQRPPDFDDGLDADLAEYHERYGCDRPT